jgi:purine-nucleoside phosphorylase
MKVDGRIDYSHLPGFPAPSVKGHAGQLLVGWVGGTPAYVLSGRAHFYEGHSMQSITFNVKAMAALGVKVLLLTNAAGGINRSFRPGDFMVLSDHINLTGDNPLCGAVADGLTRFVDLSEAYDKRLQAILKIAGKSAGVRLHSGVYLAVRGPSYETPAEIRAFERLGADAVGMSTVPETIIGRQHGLRVAAVSCITNLAAGRSGKPLSHKEVLETAVRVKRQAAQLISNFARAYGRER